MITFSTTTQEKINALQKWHRQVQAVIEILANQMFEIKILPSEGGVRGIHRYEGGVQVAGKEVVIRRRMVFSCNGGAEPDRKNYTNAPELTVAWVVADLFHTIKLKPDLIKEKMEVDILLQLVEFLRKRITIMSADDAVDLVNDFTVRTENSSRHPDVLSSLFKEFN